MAERSLIVRFIGDDRDLQRAFASSERRARGFQAEVTGVSGAVTAAFGRAFIAAGGTAAIFAGLRSSVAIASDLNEQVAKSREIFGESSREIEEWSQTTARSLGIARNEAIAAAATFGGLFRVVDFAPEESAEMSRALVQLAADLASFNNSSPEEALLAIRSGLIGEAEPLRRFGVLLSEVRVQQQALADTGKDNVRVLTDQEKALARYEIIMQDTAIAQGDAERTSKSLANQSRQLEANLADLQGRIGGGLIPVLSGLANVALLAFDAFEKLGSVRVESLDWLGVLNEDAKLDLGDIAGYVAGWKTINLLVKEIRGDVDEINSSLPTGPQRAAGARQRRRQEIFEEEAAQAKREQERRRKAFDEFTKGLGLKLDKAGLTQTLDDDIAVLREMEAAILRQIEREGKTFKLVEQLTLVRRELQDTVARRAQDQAERSRQAFEDTLDALDLKLDIAQSTSGFQDDLRALRQIEQVILQRIESEGRTTDLLRRLFEVRQEQADVQRQMAEQQREQRQSRQFTALGLTPEGEERAPGAGALSRRAASLEEQIKGTFLDTEKTRRQLDRIKAVLAGKFGEVGRDVRLAILEMLNQISSALEGGGGTQTGSMTKFVKRGIEDIIEGLGLSEEEVKALRQRLAQIGPGGTAPGSGFGAFGMGFSSSSPSGGGDNVTYNINGPINVTGDADMFVREVQKRAKRSGGSRRGTRAGANRGMG
jgi:hypothetical protein